jgi:hypothetical protein
MGTIFWHILLVHGANLTKPGEQAEQGNGLEWLHHEQSSKAFKMAGRPTQTTKSKKKKWETSLLRAS